jgi:hypothetical protein
LSRSLLVCITTKVLSSLVMAFAPPSTTQ